MPIYSSSTRELLIQFAAEEVQFGRTFSSKEVYDWFKAHWPKISEKTVRATLTALSTNHPSRVHHPVKPGPDHDRFFWLKRSQYRLWDPSTDPAPIYPRATPDIDAPSETFEKVTSLHIWQAVQDLSRGNVKHLFGHSGEYDVLANDGIRLPPKAVFGTAATAALGYQVLPSHFTDGEGTVCFQKIRAANFEIVPKGRQSDVVTAPPSDEDQQWGEGAKKLVAHLRSERGRGLSAAKKADFLDKWGSLMCERCKFDPAKEYGELGEACIEVHHTVLVSQMKPGHKTKLTDLMCLCANCHRVVHRELRRQVLENE